MHSSPDFFVLAAHHGLEPDTPFYVYDMRAIRERALALRKVLGDTSLLYSIKCNPNKTILRHLADMGLGMDAASRGEVLLARETGLGAEQILYSAPGKSVEDLRATLGLCTIVADSWGELARLQNLCASFGVCACAGLRASPAISFGGGAFPDIGQAGPDKFGVDEESLAEHMDLVRGLTHVRVRGLHVHVRSQVLSASALAGAFAHVACMARALGDMGLELSFVNLGGGLGIAHGPHGDLDLAELGEGLAKAVAPLRERALRVYLESGRYLVGEAGYFVTPILDIKESRGKTFVLAPGLLNHFLRASLAAFMQGLPLREGFAGPAEPLWSGPGIFTPRIIGKPVPGRVVTVCGTLCTANDVAARDVFLENVAVGNLLVFPRAGAYACSLSPHGFASHIPCAELVWPAD